MKNIIIILLVVFNIAFAKDSLEKVSLQLHWKYQFEFAGFIAAKEKGFYKDVGLDVELKEYQFGMNIEDEVLKNRSNYGIYNSNLLLSYLKGKPIKLMASFFKKAAIVIITKPEIKTLDNLVGKTIMAGTKEDFDTNFKYIFNEENIDTNSLHLIPHTYNIQSFIDGKCDAMTAFITDQPYSLDIKHIKYNIIDPSDYGMYNLQLELFTSAQELKKHPKRSNAFKMASIKGWEYALNHKDEIIKIIKQKYQPTLTYDFLKNEAQKTERLILPKIYTIGSIDKNFLARQLELFRQEVGDSPITTLNEYICDYNKDIINLTPQEKQYIKNNTIKVCTNPNWIPIEFIEDGKPQGISIDILQIISKNADIKLEYIKTKSWGESQQFLKEKKCDILPAAIKTKKRLKYAKFTEPYLKYDLAIITKKDKPLVKDLVSLSNKTMSRKKDTGLIYKIKAQYPKIKIKETKGYQEAIEAVANGDVYFTVATLPILTYYKNKFSLDDLQIAGYTQMKYNLSIAVRDDKPLLLNILNKALDSIDTNTHNIIYDKWTKQKIQFQTDYTLLWQLASVSLIIILIILFFTLQQKQLNTKIKQLNIELKDEVKKAIRETQKKEQLLQSQTRLAQMGEMIAMIAHQWRQPLTAISARATTLSLKIMMKHKIKDSDLKQEIDKINEYSQHLSSTINDFRDFFKEHKHKTSTTCNQLVKSTLSIVEISIKNKNIDLITNLKSDITIQTYENEVKQVILNLIKNAEDILLEKKIENPRITITTKDKIIEVSDNAGGVPSDIIDKIFDPYFSTKTKKDGTGLGLYMSKTIIEEHCGGKITVKNNKDGALFTVVL